MFTSMCCLLTANIGDLFAERAKLRQAQAEGDNELLVLVRFSRLSSFCLCLSCFPDFSAIGSFSQLGALPLSISLCKFSVDRARGFLLKSLPVLIGCAHLVILLGENLHGIGSSGEHLRQERHLHIC